MNYLAQFDESMVIGHIKEANATDADVLHSRHKSLVSSMELGRKLAYVPIVFGWLQILGGLLLIVILVGLIPMAMGGAAVYFGVWCRKRLAANIIIANAAFTKYINALNPNLPPRLG